jgi:hypothetical protein
MQEKCKQRSKITHLMPIIRESGENYPHKNISQFEGKKCQVVSDGIQAIGRAVGQEKKRPGNCPGLASP